MEKFLFCRPVTKNTTGEKIFKKVNLFFKAGQRTRSVFTSSLSLSSSLACFTSSSSTFSFFEFESSENL